MKAASTAIARENVEALEKAVANIEDINAIFIKNMEFYLLSINHPSFFSH